MNFNLIIIRLKIMFYLLLGKIRNNSSKIQLPNDNNIRQVIIFFPIDEDSFRLSLYSFRNFNFNENNIKYYFVINEKFRNIINLNKFNLIFVKYRKNKMKFCNTNDKNKLIKHESDVIIDLNVNFMFSLSAFITYLKSNIKIGFRSNFSDYFYNLQLDFKSSDILENSYKRIQQILSSL